MPVLSRFGSQRFVDENEMVFVDVETVEFPESIEMDVSYNSYLFSSNGMLYLGTCCQGGSAHLIEYNPGKNEIRSLCNMDDLSMTTPGDMQGRERYTILSAKVPMD